MIADAITLALAGRDQNARRALSSRGEEAARDLVVEHRKRIEAVAARLSRCLMLGSSRVRALARQDRSCRARVYAKPRGGALPCS